jgi:acyl-[acyl-carrier-protein] desaturase
MYQKLVRKEVMGLLEKEVGSFLEKFLTPIEKFGSRPIICQILQAKNLNMILEEIQTFAREMPYDLFVT